jgi:hypothetical protein
MNPREQPEVGGLGKKIERRKLEIQRQDEEVSPGVFKGQDGRLYTANPTNELANIPIYDWKFIK